MPNHKHYIQFCAPKNKKKIFKFILNVTFLKKSTTKFIKVRILLNILQTLNKRPKINKKFI